MVILPCVHCHEAPRLYWYEDQRLWALFCACGLGLQSLSHILVGRQWNVWGTLNILGTAAARHRAFYVENGYVDFLRTADLSCAVCSQVYSRHPYFFDGSQPYSVLHLICDGTLVKL